MAFVVLSGCEAQPGHLPGADFGAPVTTRDPAVLASLLASMSTPEETRRSADRLLVEVSGARDGARLGALERILMEPRESAGMQAYALDALVDADPVGAGKVLLAYLPESKEAELAHACATAVRLGDRRLVDGLILSMDRRGDATRPEWPAIAALAGKAVPDALWDAVVENRSTTVRVAAMELLAGIDGASGGDPTPAEQRHDLAERFRSAVVGDAWFLDMRWWTLAVGRAPRGKNESDWVQSLHRPENAALMERALAIHRMLASEADYVPAPRFTGVLAATDATAARMSRGQLRAELTLALGRLAHVHREPSSPGAPDDNPETVAGNDAALSRGDLLTIRLLLLCLKDRGTLEELQRQGLADLADTSTEHGGVLSLGEHGGEGLHIAVIPPMYADSDTSYVTSDEALRQAAAGIALFHFHFQQLHNADSAGPGAGDLKFAHAMRASCVVVTSINKAAFDVDYYTPEGAVVDLGIYHTLP